MSPQAGSTPSSEPFSPIRWQDGTLYLLDQTLLPAEETWIRCDTTDLVADAIYRLAVRGAPAIGVAAGYGLVVGLQEEPSGEDLAQRFGAVSAQLRATRPTAVNLAWALDRGQGVFERAQAQDLGPQEVIQRLLKWAEQLHRDDIATNLEIGKNGATLFAEGDRVLTHCNAGTLATAGYGTAIGVIQSSWEEGKVGQVWVDETRPLLQGARLTAWELKRLGIPFRVVTDSSAGALMSRGMVDRIVVGADRIAANGDAANKIGTYTVAVLAHRHDIPFYVAAPLSTIDLGTATGDDIPIEEREAAEITRVLGTTIAPDGADALNLAFDVTPAELITAIITEKGVLKAPFGDSIHRAFESSRKERRLTPRAQES